MRNALLRGRIGETPWAVAQRAALLDGVRSGRTAILAIHAATDSCYGWDDYGVLVGARFNATLHESTQAAQEQLGVLSGVVQEHLAEINKRLAADGMRTIDPADPDHAERYGLETPA